MACILLIEDDLMLRRALRLALEHFGHTVLEAGDGRQGFKLVKAQPFDLVVTDMIMPEMEGVETILELRKANPALPIIAISGGGRGSPADYLHIALQFGAARVLTKPFELDDFCAAVTAVLGEV